jgi:putative ABC transport system permease protein
MPRARRLARGIADAVRLLAARPIRSAISTSGLLVGGAALIVMVAAVEGAERRVLARMQAMGTNLLVVAAAPAPAVLGRPRQAATYTMLRDTDAATILSESPLAVATAPAVLRSLVVRAGPRNTSTQLLGTTPEGLRIRNIRAAVGRLFAADDDAGQFRVVLLGPTVARNLFGEADPVGETVRIGAAPFEVIGITQPLGVDPAGVDQDNRVVVPLHTAMRRVLNIPYVDAVYVQARGSADLPWLERDVQAILRQRLDRGSGQSDPFVVQNPALLLEAEREAARALNQLIGAVAALSLLIGGIGVVALGLIAIRERTAEIGLRRALGARRRDIRREFLIESVLLATLGGLGGVGAGTLAAAAAATLGQWDLVLSWPTALVGVACSTLLGLAAGVIPAARAAALEPVAALRTR